jgi:23S rRNA (cytidine1920-2'-O)/16S rRNA (cytidine1409-2'-O)-methyltransferase
VSGSRRRRFVALVDLLALRHPDVDVRAIDELRVLVDGRFVTNPRARVPDEAALRVERARPLRGDVKLSYALDRFEVAVRGRVCVDVGASAGGFTSALLNRGARRVYALDVGVGQLRGRLRVDPRVVSLEGSNLAAIGLQQVPDPVEVITIDLSYLSIANAVPQLEVLDIAPGAELVALVKPMFELRRARPPDSNEELRLALQLAADAVAAGAWQVQATCRSMTAGAGGAIEYFIHARREVTP